MSDETKVSWSGTLTLVILWGIGPFVYLCIYLVNLMKRKYGGGIENLEAVEEAVVPSKKGEEDSTTIAETDYGGKSVQNWTSTQYLFSLIGYAIGIGNVWRFCYVIAQDGGSASLFGTFLLRLLHYSCFFVFVCVVCVVCLVSRLKTLYLYLTASLYFISHSNYSIYNLYNLCCNTIIYV